ncbi:MAG: phosphonate C-P lyase system protein PhnG [Alphaproteobacteria bacterium]|nr:phosphonate C-P lyase system protein PhnG [Alphaproteobacteria bacterium]
MRNENSNREAALQQAALSDDQRARQDWISVLSTSPTARLIELFDAVSDTPEFAFLRKPESGLIMTQGRIGGTGGAFNMGEMTVTRCSVQLTDGTIGHAYQAGRDKKKARCSAILDAMLQQPERHAEIMGTVIEPLKAEKAALDAARSKKIAATKVEFFTLVRGEN